MMHTDAVIWCCILLASKGLVGASFSWPRDGPLESGPYEPIADGRSRMTLTGKVAFVTGGSRGIGLATSKALIAHGGSVVLVGTDQARLDTAGGELGSAAVPIRADVRRHEDVERAIAAAVS